MCRWLAYAGAPILIEEILFRPVHSLIDQSLAARSGTTTTNADGFGLGWYGEREAPGLYRETQPAWNDANLCDLAAQIRSPMFLAHVRAATGTAVQQTNSHPFRFGSWLFQHNGLIREFATLRRDLMLAVDPVLFPRITGTTDSELLFYLALTFGLQEDPQGGLQRMAGYVEALGREHGVENPIQMTLGLADGKHLYAVRYSSEGASRTLFHSKDKAALVALNPDLERISSDARAIVSEPLTDIREYWEEIPEASFIRVDGDLITQEPFIPSRSGLPLAG